MDDKFKCMKCGCTSSTLLDGFFYCDDCGLQAEQQFVHDDFELRKGDVKKITKPQINTDSLTAQGLIKRELTSWEGFNYVLKGLTEQMIQIGATPEIRTTVFQLWAYYLRVNQVAFFSRDEAKLPKVRFKNNFRDRKLIYNFQRIKKRSRRSRSLDSKSSARAKKRRLTTLVNSSQVSEYNSIMTNSLDVSNLADLSASDIRSFGSSSVSSANTIELEYTDETIKKALKEMTRDHLREHANDYLNELKCHARIERTTDVVLTEKITKTTLLCLIKISLDLHGMEYTMSDIARFCREGHLSISDVEHFFPKDINFDSVMRSTKTLNQAFRMFQNRDHFRINMERLCRMFHTTYQTPDMYQLCERYSDELALPEEFKTLLTRIISFCEPTFAKEASVTSSVRNCSGKFFEGRAVAYIIFILKLLFGLNGETEILMSKSAKKINAKLEDQPLFVWTDWVEYIETRKHLIAKYHPPTEFRLKGLFGCRNSSVPTLIENLRPNPYEKYEDDEEDDAPKVPRRATKGSKKLLEHFKFLDEFMKNLLSLYPNNEKNEFLAFEPSMTPFKTYLEKILEIHTEMESMLPINQTNSVLFPYLDTEPVIRELNEQNIYVKISRAPSIENIFYQTHRSPDFFSKMQKVYAAPLFVKFRTNITAEEWLQELEERKHEAKLEKENVKQLFHKTTKAEMDRCRDNLVDKHKRDKKYICQGENAAETLTFHTPSFDVWTSLTSVDRLHFEMWQSLITDLPEIFIWLMDQCALLVEASPFEIYRELMIIENYFTNILKPVDKLFGIEFKSPHEIMPDLKTIAKGLAGYW